MTYRSTPCFPFVVACGRSGTTLLRAILDSHPDMAVPPETRFIVSMLHRRKRYERTANFDVYRFVDDLGRFFGIRQLELDAGHVREELASRPPADCPEAIRRLFSAYARSRGKSRYGNKTPVHVLSIPKLAVAFPEARFVHIIRDGRDVALSYLDTGLGPRTIEGAALRWRRWVGKGRAAGRALGPERYMEVRYEDLIGDPECIVRELCSFVDLAYDDEMLRYFERADSLMVGIREPEHFRHLRLPPTKGLRDWRTQMAKDDVASFEVLAGRLLGALGYALSDGSPGTRARLRAVVGVVADGVGRSWHSARIKIRRFRRLRRPVLVDR